MSVAEDNTRNSRSRSNASLECGVFTNSHIYHANRFHTYGKLPSKVNPDVYEWKNQSIKEYAQRNSMMGGSRVYQDIQNKLSQIYSTAVR